MPVQTRREDWPSEAAYQAFRELALQVDRNSPKYTNFDISVRGSGTPGTYEISTQANHLWRVGNRVWLDILFGFASTLTGGGTGDFIIVLPFRKAMPNPNVPYYSLGFLDFLGVVNFDDTMRDLVVQFDDPAIVTGNLILVQQHDNVSRTVVPISVASANGFWAINISYLTAD